MVQGEGFHLPDENKTQVFCQGVEKKTPLPQLSHSFTECDNYLHGDTAHKLPGTCGEHQHTHGLMNDVWWIHAPFFHSFLFYCRRIITLATLALTQIVAVTIPKESRNRETRPQDSCNDFLCAPQRGGDVQDLWTPFGGSPKWKKKG